MQSPGELFSTVAAIPLNIIGEAYMSLPEGKAIYLIAFSLPLSYIRKLTDQPATRIAYCLFMLTVYMIFVFLKYLFLYLSCFEIKTMSNLNFWVMEKYYLCSVQSKTNPNQNETILVPVDEVSEFVSSHLRPDCLLIISHCSTFKAISDEKWN